MHLQVSFFVHCYAEVYKEDPWYISLRDVQLYDTDAVTEAWLYNSNLTMLWSIDEVSPPQ